MDRGFKMNNFNQKLAYLTFDDGPSIYTNEIIDVLNEYNVKGTFFIIGVNAERFPHIVQRLKNDGHQIGNHTYSHDYDKIYESPENFINEVLLANEIIYDITDQQNTLFRFPGGSSTGRLQPWEIYRYIDILDEHGFYYFDWNVDGGDVFATTKEDIIENIQRQIIDKSIALILLHDTRLITAEALPGIIELLKENNFEIKPLTEQSFKAHHRFIIAE
jgi:peptidoglycan-N-acetylglucosamine deacetylase